jgi:hypothetical protein
MAATDCDLYLDWHTGADGNLITDAIAAGSCRPTSPTDAVDAYPGTTLTAFRIETDSASPVAGLVLCDGVEYNFNTMTQGARYDHTSDYEDVVTANIAANVGVMSMGFLYKTNMNTEWSWHAEAGMNGSGEWVILAPRYHDGAQHLYIHCNSGYSATGININNDAWYWVTLQYNRTTGFASLAVYLASTMAQVGSTITLALIGSPPYLDYWQIGQSSQGGYTESGKYTWYGPVIFDWTDGTFPLIPGAAEPQDVAEVLVRLVNGTCDDTNANPLRGHLVSIMPENHVWGNAECLPEYLAVKVSGVLPDKIFGYINPCPILPPRELPPRRRRRTLADAMVAAGIYSRPWPETGSRGMPVKRRRYLLSEELVSSLENADGPPVITGDQFFNNLVDTIHR